MRPSRTQLAALATVLLLFAAGPTPGDVGGCGRTASDLGEAGFQAARKSTDCHRCAECGLTSERCVRACDAGAPSDVAFPPTCHPLRHDGEVCIDALRAASCSDYATFVDDVAPATPSECDFCRIPFDASAIDGGAR